MSELKKIVTLEGVVFNYPAGNNALDKISMELHQGEIVGLVGANGAGKTTLMKILAGYMDKTDGSIHFGGRPIEEFSNKRLNEFVTLVEQNPESQLVGPTVEDELARACRLMGYEGRVIREKVDFVLKLVRMKQAKEWYLDEMSCGERRRIALALSLIADPSVLLLDEPLSDLDQVGVKDTVATLKELKHRGLCIVVSSHRLEDILELTDRLAVLGEGRILMLDDPQKVLSNEEILKLATITLPSVQRLFLRLQAEGLVSKDKLPLSLDQAVEQFKAALTSGQVNASTNLSAKLPSGAPADSGTAAKVSESAEAASKDAVAAASSSSTAISDAEIASAVTLVFEVPQAAEAPAPKDDASVSASPSTNSSEDKSKESVTSKLTI